MTYNKAKYSINQKVLVQVHGKNWDDDYEVPGIIIFYGNYFLNGKHTYNVRLHYGDILENVAEKLITTIKESQ